MSKTRVVIVGGGTAGITAAAQLKRSGRDLDIKIVSPATKHYYQPLWTLVGGGLATFEETEREEAGLIPKGVEWIRGAVESFDPDNNRVHTEGGHDIEYDVLIVVPGLRMALDEVPGLQEALDNDPRLWTNYMPEYVTKGPQAIKDFKGGNVLFTKPNSPLKCGGAPIKILWVVEESLRKFGTRPQARIQYHTPDEDIFGVPEYAATLSLLAQERDVHLVRRQSLIEVRHEEGIAIFEHLDTHEETEVEYGLMHVSPPQRAFDFVANSPLASPDYDRTLEQRTPGAQRRGCAQWGPGGFVEVDQGTTQHVRYPNVFSCGDAATLPTAKTGAGIRKQVPAMVANIGSFLDGKPLTKKYDGYTSCPLVVGHNRVVLAEFGYDGEVMETFPFDQSKPRYSMWLLKRHLLPPLYWHGMLKGRA
jgi:sulfide:quinone oxidoreductase